jgi:5-methylcytosine-specific restriction endonuclease McrA
LSYSDYLRSSHWHQLRYEVRQRCGGVCERCGRRRMTDVHHRTYVRLGHERLSDLRGLCRRCHKRVHFWRRLFGFPVR